VVKRDLNVITGGCKEEILEKGEGKESRRKKDEGRQRRKGEGKEGGYPEGRRRLLSRRLARQESRKQEW